MRRMWTKTICEAAAKRCSRRVDFKLANDGAYQACVKYGWLDELCAHMRTTKEIRTKWNLETCREVAAAYADRTLFKSEQSGAYRAAVLNGWLVEICRHMPDRRVVPRIWTDEVIDQVVSSCKSHEDLKAKHEVVYQILRRRGVLAERTKHLPRRALPNGYWSKERCREIANRCTTRFDFVHMNQSAYKVAQESGWLDELCSHMRRRGNQKLRMLYAIKAVGQRHIYIGLSYDPVERYEQHKERSTENVKYLLNRPHRMRVCSKIYGLNEAAALEKRLIAHFRRKGWKVANISSGGGVGGPDKFWTPQRLQEVASRYQTRREFEKNDPNGYNAAATSGLLLELFERHPNKGLIVRKLTDEMLQEIANTCVTRKEFESKDSSAHRAAGRRGIMDKLFMNHTNSGLLKKPEWSLEEIRRAVKLCKTRKEFEKRFPNEYDAARKRSVINELFADYDNQGYKWRRAARSTHRQNEGS